MENKKKKNNKVSYQIDRFVDRNKTWMYPAGIILLLLLPYSGLSQYVMRIFIMIGIYYMLAMGLNILTGYTGLVSLGQAGFYAIGAYTTTLCLTKLGLNFPVALLVGGMLSSLCGFLLGLPTLRLTGSYLSIVTLGFGEIVRTIIMNWDGVTNGTLGIRNIPKPNIFGVQLTLSNHGLYYLMIVLTLFTTLLCYLVIHSKVGRAFLSIKEDELAAKMMGIKTTRYKILAFVISAFITGIAGGFYATVIGYIDQNSFVFDTSILIISVVILGGMGTFRGMLLGAMILIASPEFLRFLMDWRFVVYGLILVVMMRFRPQGVLGWRSLLPYKLPLEKEEG